MSMDKEQELRARLSNAISGRRGVVISERALENASSSKRKSAPSYRSARFAFGGVAVASVALVASLVAPSLIKPQPLFTLAGGNGGSQAMSTTAEGAPAADAKVGMIWPGYVEYNYLTENLSDQSGTGHIYQAQLTGSPEELLSKLKAYFGVTGEAKMDDWSTDQNPSYSLQNTSGTVETYLSLYWSGTGNWNYSSWDSSFWACTEPAVADSEKESDSAGSCQQPQPTPELIPSETQMRTTASQLFSDLGMEIPEASFTVYRDDWGGSAYADLTQNGFALPVSVSVGWDARGNLSYASGHSFTLVDRGEFNTISAVDAVSRIKAGNWYGSAPSSYYQSQAISATSRDVAVSSEAVAPAEEPAVEDSSSNQDEQIAVDEPMPVEEVTPQVVDLTINRSESVMLGVWDAAGGFWLVPGYLLYNDQGWFDSIICVEEGVIELPKYDEITPLIEPVPATKED